MPAIGCLMMIILPLIGAILGGMVDGPDGSVWGAGGGLAIALTIVGTGIAALVRARRH